MKEGKQAGELDRPHQYPNIDDPSPSVDVSVYENSSSVASSKPPLMGSGFSPVKRNISPIPMRRATIADALAASTPS